MARGAIKPSMCAAGFWNKILPLAFEYSLYGVGRLSMTAGPYTFGNGFPGIVR